MLLEKSGKIALCGLISSLCVMTMFLTGLIPVGTYSLPAIAGVLLMSIYIEIRSKWAWASFMVVSILSFFLAADKEAVLLFVLFFGYYPILRFNLQKIRNKILRILIKLLIFNLSVGVSFFLATKILMLPVENMILFGVEIAIWGVLLLFNITFVLYDYAIETVLKRYIYAIHPKIQKFMK